MKITIDLSEGDVRDFLRYYISDKVSAVGKINVKLQRKANIEAIVRREIIEISTGRIQWWAEELSKVQADAAQAWAEKNVKRFKF
ncbi:hypothetical protein ABZ470_23750 [Streptosporangium sp. NPDC020072]|uniref:hypothetical protein n=1 Tax=Streptosporangium sp. NPDC020072 TaxID=3154788 RepID=UPI003418D57D